MAAPFFSHCAHYFSPFPRSLLVSNFSFPQSTVNMGKKSRRRETKKDDKTISNQIVSSTDFLSSSTIVSYTSESSFQNPFDNESTPKNGWARELREVERELRHNQDSPDVVIRTAKAARVMRQFDRLDRIIKKGRV